MEKKELQDRLKQHAIDVIQFAEDLPTSLGMKTIIGQIVRSASSSAANYRAACRGKSDRDYVYKMTIVEEELDETLFWLELTVGLDKTYRKTAEELWKEGNELLSIVVRSIVTKKRNMKRN